MIELQHKYPLQNIINKTRLFDTTPKDLCALHYELGILLGREILGAQEKVYKLEKIAQHKTQNNENNGYKEERLAYYDSSDFVIIGILRAGLYIVQGVRTSFPKAPFYLVKNPSELETYSFTNKRIVIADSVVNTGKSARAFLEYFEGFEIRALYLAANVVYAPSPQELLQSFQNLWIFAVRSSHNSYKGAGQSDTGNRLFGAGEEFM